MTKLEAINLYLSKNKSAQKIVDRLMKWDCHKSVQRNAVILKMQQAYCQSFASNWGLKANQRNREKLIKRLASAGLKFEEIARIIGISRQRVWQIINVVKLKKEVYNETRNTANASQHKSPKLT